MTSDLRQVYGKREAVVSVVRTKKSQDLSGEDQATRIFLLAGHGSGTKTEARSVGTWW